MKRLRQGGRRGGRRGEARRVGVVRRLLQGLDQVVSVLWIYRPEGTFAYALKERKEEGRREILLEMLPGPSKQTANTVQRLPTQSSKFRTRPAHTGPYSAGRRRLEE